MIFRLISTSEININKISKSPIKLNFGDRLALFSQKLREDFLYNLRFYKVITY